MNGTRLDNLQDIVTPPPAPWWPPAPGWYLVALLLVLLSGWLVWRAVEHYRSNCYRREALATLDRVDSSAALPELLKRTALSAWPREVVASLSGEAWHSLLDRSGNTTVFSDQLGPLLDNLAYDPQADLDPESVMCLKQAVRQWIIHHKVERVA